MHQTALSIPQIARTAPTTLARARAHRQRQAAQRRHASLLGALVMLIIAVSVLAAAAIPALNGTDVVASDATETVRVQQGDTLWSIAARTTTPGKSVAGTVEDILDLNGLEDPSIAAGTLLTVPVPASDAVASR